MANLVSLQDVLNALGGPLVEKSLWALLYQSYSTLQRAIQESDKMPALLITPETILLSRDGNIQILPGIPRSSSDFSAPEKCNSTSQTSIEKCYVYSLGMSLLAAMRNELEDEMNPEVSEVQHELLLSMTNKNYDHRPYLEDIFKHCSSYFASQSHASEEVDKLVSYVFGPTHESYSDSEDYKIDEADLEAEIQQVMNMRGTGSIENLYPPSYGSRGSSSLSLNSSSGYQRSISLIAPSVRCREKVNMYSSLPMVFTPATHEKPAHNHSDDNLLRNSAHQESTYGRKPQTETKSSYGSHFYTPLRGRRPAQRKIKGNNNQKKQAQPHLPLYRSSSDGKKKSSLESDPFINLLIDDIPPLPPKPVAKISVSEVDRHHNILAQHETSLAVDSSFDYSVPDQSKANDSFSNAEFNFPSPPVLPDTHFDSEQSFKQERVLNPLGVLSESLDAAPTIGEASIATEGSCSTLKHDSEQGEKPALTSKQAKHSSTSIKKLGEVFGLEFLTINGFQHEGKGAEVRSIPSDRRVVEVIMLNNCTIHFVVELSSTCRDLFNQVVAHQSLEETHIFGLAIKDSCVLFLESDHKVMKYAPEGWSKNSSSHMPKKKFTVFFCVKYFVENVNHLRLSQTRHLYYLQLRKDVLEGKIYCHEQSALKLAAYSLQAEMGNKSTDTRLYFHIEFFLSSQVINKLGRPVIQNILPGMHSELEGQNRETAELCYLKEVQTFSEYGMVFYEVAKGKKGKIGSVLLGLSVRGLVIYNVHKGIKTPSSHWPWKKITNLSFVNRKFVLQVEDHSSLSFYTDSYKKARYLLHLSVNYHRFQLLPGGPTEVHTQSNDAFHPSITPVYISEKHLAAKLP